MLTACLELAGRSCVGHSCRPRCAPHLCVPDAAGHAGHHVVAAASFLTARWALAGRMLFGPVAMPALGTARARDVRAPDLPAAASSDDGMAALPAGAGPDSRHSTLEWRGAPGRTAHCIEHAAAHPTRGQPSSSTTFRKHWTTGEPHRPALYQPSAAVLAGRAGCLPSGGHAAFADR